MAVRLWALARARFTRSRDPFLGLRRRPVWAGIEWVERGRPSVLGLISGAVAGLGTITPASGYVLPWQGVVIGAIAGGVCYFRQHRLESPSAL